MVPMLGRLREARERAFLSQAALAERAGLSRLTITMLETGRSEARLMTVRRLAEALGVPPAELVGPFAPKDDAPPAGA